MGERIKSAKSPARAGHLGETAPEGRIGIFDSGLGGLIIAKAIIKKLPKYDFIYLGDTKNLPYGEKSPAKIYNHTEKAIDFLFKKGCSLIIIACNTASALALRKIQQQYLPAHYPGRRVLGVVIPTLEEADKNHRGENIGVIATRATINSHIYKKELKKIDAKAKIFELATPKLVPLIEQNSLQKAQKTLELYLKTLKQKSISALVLGCTHYPILKSTARKVLGSKVKIVSQDEIVPGKLLQYLNKHKNIRSKLSKTHKRQFFVTSQNKNFDSVAKSLVGKKIKFELAVVK